MSDNDTACPTHQPLTKRDATTPVTASTTTGATTTAATEAEALLPRPITSTSTPTHRRSHFSYLNMAPRRKIFPLALLATVSIFLLFLFRRQTQDSLLPQTPPAEPREPDWTDFVPHFPRRRKDMIPLPTAPPLSLPRIQHDFHTHPPQGGAKGTVLAQRRECVKKAMKTSWEGYRKYAWGSDEVTPVSCRSKDTLGGKGVTIIDSLDTLFLMGLDSEFDEAVQHGLPVYSSPEWTINVFEVNIRHLGGLLGAYDLSARPVLLEKALELGEVLYAAFDTPNHFPTPWLRYPDAVNGTQTAGSEVSIAVVGTLSLEFTRLAQLTGERKFYDAVARITDLFEGWQEKSLMPGLWPRHVNLRDERMGGREFTLGAGGDSMFEYLVKGWVLLGGGERKLERMYLRSVDVAAENLVFRPMVPVGGRGGVLAGHGDWGDGELGDDILFPGTATVFSGKKPSLKHEVQHLGCFAGGMYGIGGKVFGNDTHVNIGERMARGCAWAYGATPTGIMPETFWMLPCPSRDQPCWDEQRWKEKGKENLPKGILKVRNGGYYLRPEAVESLFIMYRITGKVEFQEAAWRMFERIVEATEANAGFSSVVSVMVGEETVKKDSMQSFWLAETLKYFWLIFSEPDVVSLDEYVFNTEAHPFKRPLPMV